MLILYICKKFFFFKEQMIDHVEQTTNLSWLFYPTSSSSEILQKEKVLSLNRFEKQAVCNLSKLLRAFKEERRK